jgi:hypothetical protein
MMAKAKMLGWKETSRFRKTSEAIMQRHVVESYSEASPEASVLEA